MCIIGLLRQNVNRKIVMGRWYRVSTSMHCAAGMGGGRAGAQSDRRALRGACPCISLLHNSSARIKSSGTPQAHERPLRSLIVGAFTRVQYGPRDGLHCYTTYKSRTVEKIVWLLSIAGHWPPVGALLVVSLSNHQALSRPFSSRNLTGSTKCLSRPSVLASNPKATPINCVR